MMDSHPFRHLFKIDSSYWLLVLPIIHDTVPWVQYRLKGLVPFAFAMLWLLPKFSKITSKLRMREGRAFFAALFWFLLLVFLPEFFAIIGSHGHMQYHQFAVVTTQVILFLVAFYTIAYRKFNELRFLTMVTLGGFVVAGIASVRGMGMEGLEGARTMVGLQNAGHTISMEAIDKSMSVYDLGLGGYGSMYKCAWLVGILMFAFALTKDKKLRAFYFVVAAAAAISVKQGGLGTPAGIIAIETMVFALWLSTRSKKLVSICGYSLIALFFIYAATPQVFGFLSGPLDLLADTMSEGSIRDRIVSVSEAFKGEASYAFGRAQLQLTSFRTFCRYPFLGTFGPFAGGTQMDLGGHSYVLDLMGGYGLFGVFVLCMFVWSLSRYFNVLGQMYFGSRWLVMPVFFMGVFIFSGIMNPVSFFANAVYLMPGIAWLALSPQEQEAVLWRLGSIGWRPTLCRYV